MPKLTSYYIEKYAGYLFAVLATILGYCFIDFRKFEINDLFFDKLVDFSGIFFGFLITILTILISLKNEKTELLKQHNRFKDLIFFNKEAVIVSAVICIYAIFILAFKGNIHFSFASEYDLKKYGSLLLIFLITLMVSKTFSFLKIFYDILQKE